jgi:hypothetical protein
MLRQPHVPRLRLLHVLKLRQSRLHRRALRRTHNLRLVRSLPPRLGRHRRRLPDLWL